MVEFIFSQYKTYETIDIVLEITAVIFGLISVLFSRKNNIWVFPTGLVSTVIYVYLLYKVSLLGEMLINFYYTTMSFYGWYLWTRKKDGETTFRISETTQSEWRKAGFIFIGTVVFVIFVYICFDKFNTVASYVDTVTSGIFFVGMWLMAKRKVENWLWWIVGDCISVPLYCSKGLWFTAFQFFVFTILAYFGYIEWKKHLQQPISNR